MYDPVQFGSLCLRGDRPFFIAEAGVNYENSIEVALRMVDEAAVAGADAIKFQSYKADALASRNSPSYWDLKSEPTTSQHALFQKYDHFNDREYESLAQRAKEKGIVFLSTPFDEHFADILAPLMPAIKIASADITNYPFLRYCARKLKPMIISVGASTLGEIERAVTEVRNLNDQPIALLHCVLSYPCKPEDANLQVIRKLRTVFPDCIIGYSDHVPSEHEGLCLTTAWLMGARIVEKHYTLDKTKLGNDHYHAFDPSDIRKFRNACAYSTSLWGTGQKTISKCEEEARRQARRSLVAIREIRLGEFIREEDIAVKRPGTGIAPEFLEQILDSRAVKNINADDILQWDMFVEKLR